MYKVLIVEDESIIARDVSRILTTIQNISTLVADSYSDAIRIIDEQLPDLILLDIKLYDDEDAGIRIAKYINQKYKIPFVFLSGHATQTYLQKAKKESPITFITKPIDPAQLRTSIFMAINEDNQSKLKHIILQGKLIEGVTEDKITHEIVAGELITTEKIDPNSIIIIKTFNQIKRNSILIKLGPSKHIICNTTINEIHTTLPAFFIKVHSSFIVNKNYISGTLGKTAVRVGVEVINFGTEFKKKKFRFF